MTDHLRPDHQPADSEPTRIPAVGRRVSGSAVGSYILILLTLYAAGLSRDVSEPWVGMHDWNGAFFSQLARNLLRYPVSVHHGMPIVAVGEAVPPPAERSIYATHPPGLVWLLAGVFAILGQAEWAARLLPIIASLVSLWLLLRLVERERGFAVAIRAGLIYAVMPMAVYFGRMVDHEAVCLCFMLLTLQSWRGVEEAEEAAARFRAWVGTVIGLVGAVWVDWSGVLFAGLFCVFVLLRHRRGGVGRGVVIRCWAVAALATIGMVVYLTGAGLAWRWSDLSAIFLTRSTDAEGAGFGRDLAAPGTPASFFVDNMTWPVLAFAVIGLASSVLVWGRRRARGGATARPETATPETSTRVDIGLWVVHATGVIWLLVFWRQYERHIYWLYYLGPAAAIYASIGLGGLRGAVRSWRSPARSLFHGAMVAVVVVASLRGSDDFFARLSYPPDQALAWQTLRREYTQAGDRVLLNRNPLRVERRGGYVFRNIVPPQLAFYLDRPFDVESDPARAVPRLRDHALYVMPVLDALAAGGGMDLLQMECRSRQIGPLVLFTQRARSGAREPVD